MAVGISRTAFFCYLSRVEAFIYPVPLQAERLETAGQPVRKVFSVPGGVSGITPLVQEILIAIEGWHTSQNINCVILFYHNEDCQ